MFTKLFACYFCVEMWYSTLKLLKINENEKHMPLNNNVTSRAKKLQDGMGKSRSISRQEPKFPIQIDVRFKCEEKF